VEKMWTTVDLSVKSVVKSLDFEQFLGRERFDGSCSDFYAQLFPTYPHLSNK
jgi:hypothetical protein